MDPQRGRFAPDALEASEAQLVRCQELKLDPAVELRAFKLHEFNRAYTDWPRRFSKWIEESKIRRETDAAKAIAAAQRPRQGFAPALPPLEPNAKHRAFADHYGLDLDAVMRKMSEDRIVETLGLGRAKEIIGERLSLLVRKKKGSTNAASSA